MIAADEPAARPRGARASSAALPFALVILAYLVASAARLAVNPDDKLLPWPSAFVEAMRGMAFEPDKRSGDYLFWVDTAASLLRLLDRPRDRAPRSGSCSASRSA